MQTKVSATKWVYGLTFKDVDYTYDTKVAGTWKGTNPYTEPAITVTSQAQAKKKKITTYLYKGEGVKWELMEAGLLTEADIDGICGPKTVAAILEYQKSCKITADGLAGQTTRKYLAAA